MAYHPVEVPDLKFEMTVDAAAINNIIEHSRATEIQIDAARKSALRKTGAWLKTQVKKGAARELGITQKSIENRFYFKNTKKGSDEITVWIGTAPVEPFAIGNPSILGSPLHPTGIKVRNYSYPGAFISRVYGKNKKIWIRVESFHYDHDLYPTGARGSGTFPGSKGRFPIARAAISIDDVVKQVLESVDVDLGNKYEEILARELNYFVNVKGKTA